jgi:hypothetical protein
MAGQLCWLLRPGGVQLVCCPLDSCCCAGLAVAMQRGRYRPGPGLPVLLLTGDIIIATLDAGASARN